MADKNKRLPFKIDQNLEALNVEDQSADSGFLEESKAKRDGLKRQQMMKKKKDDKPGFYGWGSVTGFQTGVLMRLD
ncbi:hypothetical protein [Leadbettera azotonutricia]|uniref:Uncharacterized protein n=1 Tax=Leadbettera azotonutricia (strain ATCC BAA-888 / DSM 13862 / ZAS-9) TaxID=545695 RepID=F5YE65_LEAAZ|nr:hypothetical protein [Leadbettera azotonutricia]AEF82475.1 hypothetical protein TREAZ_0262 [Leadbettera azotonutricia ZAS-9]